MGSFPSRTSTQAFTSHEEDKEGSQKSSREASSGSAFIDLSCAKLVEFPYRFEVSTEHIESLVLMQNPRIRNYAGVEALTSLTELDISFNSLKRLPEQICRLEKLRTLRVTGNELVVLPESIGKLSRLESLHCENNMLTSFPTGLSFCSSLMLLSCDSNRFLSLPMFDVELGAKSLSISRTVHFSSKGPRPSIAHVDFASRLSDPEPELPSNRRNTYLQPRLSPLMTPSSDMRISSVSRRSVSSVNISVPTLIQAVEKLTMSHNRIGNISSNLMHLHNLTYLDLSHNKIKSIPDSVLVLGRLETLLLHFNGLAVVPINLFRLKRLRVLNLCNNHISRFPDPSGDLLEEGSALEVLQLSNNWLSAIPSTLNLLCSLKQLTLTSNILPTIPNLSTMSKLTYLDLSYNRINHIPAEHLQMASLQRILLTRNEINLPVEFDNMAWPTQIDYLRGSAEEQANLVMQTRVKSASPKTTDAPSGHGNVMKHAIGSVSLGRKATR